MHRSLRALLTTAAVVLAAAPAAAARFPHAQDVVANVLVLSGDLGPPPAFDLAAYAPYAGPGTGSFEARVRVELRGGSVVAQRYGSLAWLYPDTAFVRWLLGKYVFLADGTANFRHAYPGYGGFPTAIPSILSPWAPDSVVRRADACDGDGRCVFTRLRPGRYVLYSEIYLERRVDIGETHVDAMVNPTTGELEPHTTVVPRYAQIATGGFMLLSNGYYNVVADEHRAGDAESTRVVATFGCAGHC
ncbi:MAG: hypothetical protein JOZ86_02955 [Candidatus Eremiobacteraeota bacterium]|nr:hypothetical protein [Candidatus Eremiobacteraeota bacterium]